MSWQVAICGVISRSFYDDDRVLNLVLLLGLPNQLHCGLEAWPLMLQRLRLNQ